MLGKVFFVKNVTKFMFAAAISVALWGCVQPQPMATTAASSNDSKTSKQTTTVAPLQTAKLKNSDCIKCHIKEPNDINRNGGKHKTAVTCLDCHVEHLPNGVKTIPECSRCHNPSKQAHFTLGKREVCLGCHRNPHTPLDISIADTPASSKACKTCHPEKAEEFKKYPSKHAQKNCTFCHPQKHKRFKTCLECHKPHASFMVFKDCLKCHKPHSPLNITYADDTPSKYCGACHDEIYTMLSKSKAKHSKFNCAFCHKRKHPTVPKCQDCHQKVHSESILSRFNDDCLKCHQNPHDLLI